jgi:hypothetical protein
MRFPKTFKRQKGGSSGDPALGSDTPPTTTPPSEAVSDNLLTCRLRDVNGWPVQRIGVCWNTTAGSPTPLNGDLYFWEDATGHWYKINDAPLSLKPAQLFFFDTVTIGEPAPLTKNLLAAGGGSYAEAGSMEVMLVLTDPGAQVAGVFNVAMGPDLTTVGT